MMADIVLPTVSVIIPTHNRCESLRRTLTALAAQTYPSRLVDVTVVLDACSDGTEDMLRHHVAPYALRCLALPSPNKGPAYARNYGAASTVGQFLVFLDDDVEPAPTLIQAHITMHQQRPDHLVIGPYWPVLQRRADCFRVSQQRWWNDKFVAMQRYGHRFTYTDVLTGNLSLESRVFRQVEGFDPTFPFAHEDYEFGARLIAAGYGVAFAREASASHHEHEHMTVARSCQRARLEGKADVLIGRRHRHLLPTLPLAAFRDDLSMRHRVVHWFSFRAPSLGDRLAIRVARSLVWLDRARLRKTWSRVFKVVRHYWYLRGVAEEAGDRRSVLNLLQEGPARENDIGPEVEIDLQEGVPAAEQRLDAERPHAVRLRYGSRVLGRIPSRPGSERLRGEHLRSLLAGTLAWPFLTALTTQQATIAGAHSRSSGSTAIPSPGSSYAYKNN